MIVKQGEWNIVQIGNTKYQNMCKNVLLKTVTIRSGPWLSQTQSLIAKSPGSYTRSNGKVY